MLPISGIHIIRKNLFLIVGLTITTSIFGFKTSSPGKPYPVVHSYKLGDYKALSKAESVKRLKQKAFEAKSYVSDNGFNERYCFLIDMRIPSGKNRFFVYDLKKNTIEAEGLVSHGKGSEKGSGGLLFSNTPNSLCTSLGKYKVGVSYNGRFGLAYKLHGLDKSNSKAFERFVVMHAHDCVPDTELAPEPLCLSQGCPTVSPVFLRRLKAYLDRSAEPILLWIYY